LSVSVALGRQGSTLADFYTLILTKLNFVPFTYVFDVSLALLLFQLFL